MYLADPEDREQRLWSRNRVRVLLADCRVPTDGSGDGDRENPSNRRRPGCFRCSAALTTRQRRWIAGTAVPLRCPASSP